MFAETDPARDLANKREVILNNGTKYIVERDFEYGFWGIRMFQGNIPRELSGRYTSFALAAQAITAYLSKVSHLKKVEKIKEK